MLNVILVHCFGEINYIPHITHWIRQINPNYVYSSAFPLERITYGVRLTESRMACRLTFRQVLVRGLLEWMCLSSR